MSFGDRWQRSTCFGLMDQAMVVRRDAGWRLAVRSVLAMAFVCLLVSAGCETKPEVKTLDGGLDAEAIEALKNRPLYVLCVGSEVWADEMSAQYIGQFDNKVEIEVSTEAEFETFSPNSLAEYDVVIVPPWAVGPLAMDRQLLELRPENLERLNASSLFSMDRQLSSVSGETFGVSLGMPLQAMFVRPDKTEDLNSVLGYVQWENWHDAAVAANRNQLMYVEPLANGGAARSFLMRGVSYARSQTQVSPFFDRATNRPLINGRPFVRALTQMQEEYAKHVDVLKEMDDVAAVRRVFLGEAAACIGTIPNMTQSSWTDEQLKEVKEVEIQSLPTAGQYFNQFTQEWQDRSQLTAHSYQLTGLRGRVACIMRTTRKSESALRFLEVLSNSPTVESMAPLAQGIGPAKAQQLDQLELWFGRAYSPEALGQIRQIYASTSENQSSISQFPPLKNAARLLDILDQAVLDALENGSDPQETLDRCVQQWQEAL